jgi:hypothetical protein
MTHQHPFPDEETRKGCLKDLRETNRHLELYNLFLEDAIAKIDIELRQQRRERLLKKANPIEQATGKNSL